MALKLAKENIDFDNIKNQNDLLASYIANKLNSMGPDYSEKRSRRYLARIAASISSYNRSVEFSEMDFTFSRPFKTFLTEETTFYWVVGIVMAVFTVVGVLSAGWITVTGFFSTTYGIFSGLLVGIYLLLYRFYIYRVDPEEVRFKVKPVRSLVFLIAITVSIFLFYMLSINIVANYNKLAAATLLVVPVLFTSSLMFPNVYKSFLVQNVKDAWFAFLIEFGCIFISLSTTSLVLINSILPQLT